MPRRVCRVAPTAARVAMSFWDSASESAVEMSEAISTSSPVTENAMSRISQYGFWKPRSTYMM